MSTAARPRTITGSTSRPSSRSNCSTRSSTSCGRRKCCRWSADQRQHFLLPQLVELLVEQFDLELGLDVDPVIVLGLAAVDIRLAVLAHHDERRRISGLEGESEVEEDERIGIPMADPRQDVEHDPQSK